jgi:hypothetical protein
MPRPASRQNFGSWVLLPDPVSPATIITGWVMSIRWMSSRRSHTGSAGS